MISREEVQHLAELARLRISEDEVRGLQKDISNILDYVGQVSATEAEASFVAPLVHNVMRDDVERRADDVLAGKRTSILSQFPKREGDYNVVRKIIQKDE